MSIADMESYDPYDMEGKSLTTQMQIRISEPLKRAFEQAARANGEKPAAWARRVLIEAVQGDAPIRPDIREAAKTVKLLLDNLVEKMESQGKG